MWKNWFAIFVALHLMIFSSGCIDEFPDKRWGGEFYNEAYEHQVLDNGAYDDNVSVYFEIDALNNYSYGVNMYAITHANYNDFISCDPFIYVEELSWLNSTGDSGTHDFSTDVNGMETVYIVVDNHHCDEDNTEIQDVSVYYEITWHTNSSS